LAEGAAMKAGIDFVIDEITVRDYEEVLSLWLNTSLLHTNYIFYKSPNSLPANI
jgi:hypothetical protein